MCFCARARAPRAAADTGLCGGDSGGGRPGLLGDSGGGSPGLLAFDAGERLGDRRGERRGDCDMFLLWPFQARGQAIMLLELLSLLAGVFLEPCRVPALRRRALGPACRRAGLRSRRVCRGSSERAGPGGHVHRELPPGGVRGVLVAGAILKLLLVRGHAEVLGEPLGVREPSHVGEVAFEIFAPAVRAPPVFFVFSGKAPTNSQPAVS